MRGILGKYATFLVDGAHFVSLLSIRSFVSGDILSLLYAVFILYYVSIVILIERKKCHTIYKKRKNRVNSGKLI